MAVTHTTRPASADEIAAEMDRRGKVIERLEADLAEAALKVEHLAKQEADIRAAYELRRASEAEFARENKRLDREWEASIEQAKYWQGVAERALAKQAAFTVALKPFADLGVGEGPDDEPDAAPYRILRGAIRRARAALEGAL